MKKEIKKEKKGICDLHLHETLVIMEEVEQPEGFVANKKIEITKVPGGFIYSFEYPGWKLIQNVFVPFNYESKISKTSKN